jgi:hypothetical protein
MEAAAIWGGNTIASGTAVLTFFIILGTQTKPNITTITQRATEY